MTSQILRERKWFSQPIILTLAQWMAVVCVLSVFRHSRLQITCLYRFPVFIEPGAQFSCRFTDVIYTTILTLDILNVPTFLFIRDLILWSHQTLAEGVMGLVANVNTILFESSLKHLGNPTVVGEHNKFLFTGKGCLTSPQFT